MDILHIPIIRNASICIFIASPSSDKIIAAIAPMENHMNMKLLVTISITTTKNAINNQIIISNTNYSPFQPLIHSYIYLLLY